MLLLRIIDSHRQDSCEAAQCSILQMKAYDDAMSSKTYRRSPLVSMVAELEWVSCRGDISTPFPQHKVHKKDLVPLASGPAPK